MTPGADYDLFRGAPKERVVDRVEKLVRKSAGKIKFSKASVPQCAQFSRDGRMLVTGSKDGFVEVWDFDKCKLRKDLDYQAKVLDVLCVVLCSLVSNVYCPWVCDAG